MTLRRAAVQLRKVSSIPVLLAALLLAASSSLLAQDRGGSRPSDSGDAPSPRIAVSSESHSSGDSSPGWSGGNRTPEPVSPSGGDASPSPSPSNEQRGNGGGGRTAVPVGPGGGGEPHRQPPHNPGGGHGGHGGHGGYYGGGYYYPNYGGWGYYPYWGYYGPYWGGFWAGYGFGWYYGAPYYYGTPYRTPYYSQYGHDDGYGALDLDVSPGRTEVYIDGRYYGKVDAYDGFPQYLWLPRGTYDVAFYLDGFKTIARQISLNQGMVVDIDDRMERGESTRPEDLVTKSHDRRDERLRYEDERRERLEQGERGDYDDEARMEEWRNRAREHQRDRDPADANGREDQERQDEVQSDARGRLVLNVEPEDASVYLDGHFVGTGVELAGLQRGLTVDAGKHHLAIVRPGRRPEERYFEVEAGEEVELEVELALGSR